MRKLLLFAFTFCFLLTTTTTFSQKKKDRKEVRKEKRENKKEKREMEEENDEYDGPDKAIEFEIERTKDLNTGKVPAGRLWQAIKQTEQLKNSSSNFAAALSWTERGPNGDFTVGGNPRPTGQQTSGRIRAAMIDSLDPTHNTVWVAGVDGGLWKTTNINNSPANWTLVNDYFANLAVSAICQDPRPGFQNIMYFCTGESYGNADAVRGIGVFKSTDAGVTWNLLANSTAFINGTRILCDFQGNVYLGTRNTGLVRSNDGGVTWTTITPAGIGTSVCDLEISSTSAAGRLHVTTGIFSQSGYSYTDNPATVTSGSGWTAATTPFTTFNQRTELGISGNVLYACPANGSYQVPTIWKSTDGGANWAAVPTQPSASWASGQGWYAISCAINPANSNEVIVGGLDTWKSTNSGTSWSQLSSWATGTTGFYVHADQHNLQWWDGGTKLMFACDGGIHYSTNGGTTNNDRNKGLRLKQFYSVAIHPTKTNYFLAGAQDNGMHRMDHPGLDSSIECVGGDGCYSAIDQADGNFQFGSYVFNVYRRSTNNGATWSTPVNNQSTGRFVNPWDYDNTNFKIYACNNAGTFLRWNDPRTGASTDVVSVSSFNGQNVSAVFVSPYTANRVYFGTGNGTISRVDNADVGTTIAGTVINSGSGMPAGYVNSIVTGSNDQNLIACFTNYGVQNVWITTNGGTTWTAIDGNLPDMPVRWALFHPDTDTKAYIATETGVWETDLINGAATIWTASTSFPTVRTDMIKYRASDRTIAAGTHGRGIFSAIIPTSTANPNVTINQAAAQPDPTSASPINFTVVFDQPVINFTTGDVTLSGTAGATTATVTPPGGSGTTFNVAVSGMTTSGTVIATIAAGVCTNAALDPNNASTSTDNTVTYNLPTTPPTVTINQAAAQPDPTSLSPINFTVVFNQPVTGFTSAGVNLSGTAGATTKVVTGGPTTYNVAVSGMTACGTVIATVPAGVAQNASAQTNTASTSTDNTVTYLTANPNVTINQAAAQPDPTSTLPINFTVVFDQPVTGFTGTGVTISGTAPIGTLTRTVTGGPSTYNVAVSGFTGSGTVIATIAAGVANSACPSPNNASTSTDNTVTYNAPPPPSCLATFSYTGPAVAIPDNTPAGVNIPITVSGAGTIADLDFRFDAAPASTCDATVGNVNAAADHTFIGDLIFTLTSPNATSVVLVNRRGGTRENICTTLLDDDGAFPSLSTVTSTSGLTLSGNFAPDNPLSAFDGQNANGVWTLNVSDNASIDIGSMRRFSLIITSLNPTVNPVSNQTVCAGSPTTAVTFTGTPATATYNWTNNNTAIGLAASGTGNIPSFTATNATAAAIVATITVTPTLGACTGTPTTFTITVNPSPVVNAIPNQVVCQNAPTTAVNFTGTPAGVIFQWTNNNTLIGLAASGTGNIPSFIAQNPTNVQQVATITVTPVTGLSTPITTTFAFTGGVQTYTVPAGITSVNIKTWGAQGNSNALSAAVGGLGGYAEGNLAVTPGQVLNVLVGGGAATSINGGFNGGGDAGVNSGCATAQGGGGGGASDVRIAPYALANRVIVGAGGGGAGANRVAGCGRGTGGGGGGGYFGGGGGAGWPGIPGSQGPVPTGGTQVAGGAGGITTFTPGPTNGFPGALGVGGAGGTEVGSAQGGSATAEPGGIGGGLTGGSGLYNQANNWCGQSGAGGSSYIGGVTGGLTTPGLRTGAGQVQITYTPASATTCFGTARTFTITVNPNANLIIVADPGTTICEGDPTLLTVYDAGGSGPIALTQSSSQVPVAGSVACNAGGLHTDNSYWRAYNLAPLGLPSALTVTTVTFGIERATGGAQPVTVNLYTQNAGPAFPGGTRTLVGTQNATVNNSTLTTQTVTFATPVVVPNTAVLIVELFTPSGQATGRGFFIGSNPAAQTGPSYLSATACGVANPTDIAALGFPNMRIILNVGGTVGAAGPIATGTFLWSPALGLSSTTSNPVAASPMNTTTYTVTRTTVPGGCQASAQVTVTVNKRPVVTTQPTSIARCSGSSATFTAAATGTALTYQWQLSTAGCAGPWVNVPTVAPYSGGTTPVLNITPVDGTMNGYAYRLVVSGACAPINNANISNCVTLTVNPLPNIAVTPPVSCGGIAGINGTALTVTAFPPPVPGSVSVNSGAINVPIPDATNVAATANLTIAGIPANATIADVRINMNINHTWVGDVDVNIKAPNAAILNLVAGLNGGTGGNAGDNFTNTAFSSLGGLTISGAPDPRTGTFAAEARAGRGPIGFVQTVNTWGALYPTATAANGVWTLAMGDRVGGDVGTLTNWSITINYSTPGTGAVPVLNYVWSPATGLFTLPNATGAYTGQNLSTVYAAPTVQTTYTVTATDAVTGCVSTASALVNYTPPPPTVTPNPVAMCLGDAAVRLIASSSTAFSTGATSGTINLAVPDNTANGVNSNLTIAGIPANGNIAKISVTLNMPHTYPADMILNLKAPNGQILSLYKHNTNTDNGAASIPTAGFFGAVVNSTASTVFSSVPTPYRYGQTAPVGPFKADALNGVTNPGYTIMDPAGFVSNAANFGALYTPGVGSSANGTWTLAMADGGPGDLGTLTSWSLNIDYVIGVASTPAIWSPIAGLFNDPLATIPYAGTPRDTVWARPTTLGPNVYTVTVNNLITTTATPTTPMAGGNGNNLVTFNVKNNNPFPVTLSSVSSNTFGSGAVTSTVYYKTTGNAGNPGPISAANGFVQFGSAASTVTAGAMNLLVSGLTLQVPAGATYAIAIDMTGATFPAYTNGAATTVTYSNGGCDIITGGNVGWGGPNAPGTPANNPRNFNGSITFLGSGPGTCQSPPRTVTVTVNAPTKADLTIPVNATVCTDKVATFSAAVASGTGPFSYQWIESRNSGNTYSPITNGGVYSGATTSTLTITAPPVSMNGYFYRCVITGAAPCASDTSRQALLTVNPLPTIVLSLDPATPWSSLFPGLTTRINSKVTPVVGQSFTWLRNGVVLNNPDAGVVSGLGTGSILVNVDGMGTYTLRVTDVNGCTNISQNSITIKDSASGKCFIYPNPTSGQFEVRYYSTVNNVVPRSLTVFDAKGERVFTKLYPIGRPYDRMPVDMRAYGKGLYWVEVTGTNGERLTMCRVVIQ